MLEKFDRTRSKFRGFVQQVNLFLRLHPSCYPDDFIQVEIVKFFKVGWIVDIGSEVIMSQAYMSSFHGDLILCMLCDIMSFNLQCL
jgi:hypothetical protein